MDVETFNRELWETFRRSAPNVSKVRDYVEEQFFAYDNDHVAFRCLGIGPLTVSMLEKPLLKLGYHCHDEYVFHDKGLYARSYIMRTNKKCPRVFLSEPIISNFSSNIQNIAKAVADSIPQGQAWFPSIFMNPKPWLAPVSYGEYLEVRKESEYIAWVLANGCIPNHFTVSLNINGDLSGFRVDDVLTFLEENYQIRINEFGGRVKGGADVLLEQGSTMADVATRHFSDCSLKVPTCFYEFALRYKDAEGNLFDGFIESSASKIFESTNGG